MLFSKLSLLFFFRSVFTLGRVYTTLWAITLGIVIFYNIPSIILTFFSCIPVQATWDRTRYPEAACLNISVPFIQGIFNAVTDFILLALALPIIWNVQISLSQKIGLGVVFLIGSLLVNYLIVRFIKLPSLTCWIGPVLWAYYVLLLSSTQTAHRRSRLRILPIPYFLLPSGRKSFPRYSCFPKDANITADWSKSIAR